MLDLKRRLFYVGQIALSFLGLSLLTVGVFAPFSGKEIVLSIGITFIATSFIAFFNKWLIDEDNSNKKPELTKINVPPETSETSIEVKWGLITIHKHRCDKNDRINNYIKETAAEIDVMTQNSLHGLRLRIGKELRNRLSHNLKMRILIPESHLPSEDIKELIEWYNKLDNNQQENVKIRSYDGAPQDLYYRVDDMIFIGPYFIGERFNANDQTITYEFKKDSNGGKVYSEYFEQIWDIGKRVS